MTVTAHDTDQAAALLQRTVAEVKKVIVGQEHMVERIVVALLAVMAERQVSIAGKTFPLPKPFVVIATQNPIESEGVYPLPEAQRDRFLMKVNVGYPGASEEMQILQRMSVDPPDATQILDPDSLIALQHAADEVAVHE